MRSRVCRARLSFSRGSAVIFVAAVVSCSVGCNRTLFRESDERSPFARYDRVRSQDATPYRFNEFGRRVPNLRERLTYGE
ncbi:MAG: hypothetical protein AAFQ31_10435 [Planctomycetota bacterium]